MFCGSTNLFPGVQAVLLPSDMSLVEDQGLAADGGLSRFASMGRTTGPPVAPTMSSQHTRTGSQHGLRMDGDFSSASVAPRSQDFAPPRPPMSDGSGVEPSTGPHVGFQTPIRDVSPEPPASESEAPSNRSSTAVNSSS